MNDHFVNLTDNEIQQIDYLYIGKLMFREFDKHIDWNVIKQKQLSKEITSLLRKQIVYLIALNIFDLVHTFVTLKSFY